MLLSTLQRNNSHRRENMVEKGIFVTRVKPRTTIKDIQNLVKDETGISVHREKLKSKYDTYSSFYIPCTRKVIRELL